MRIRLLCLGWCMLVTACAHLPPARAPSASASPAIETASAADRVRLWSDDLTAFDALLRERHAGLFALQTEAAFTRAIEALRLDLPSLRDDEIVVRIRAISASIGSGHSSSGAARGTLVPRQLPFTCVALNDGLLITATDASCSDLRGARIEHLNDHPIEEVLAAMAAIAPHENSFYLRHQVASLIAEAETLQGLGLAEDPDAIRITARHPDGTLVSQVVTPLPRGARADLVSVLEPSSIAWTRRPRSGQRAYGTAWCPGSDALYVWYDRCANQKEESVASFSRAALAEIDRRRPGALIFDLRRNGGGNSALLRPFIDGVIACSWLDDPTRLFVLIGPATFSSAALHAEDFRARTRATLVGEPTGGRPGSWKECRWDWLPNSLLQVNYMLIAPRFRPNLPDATYPDIEAASSCAAWLSGEDLAWNAAIDASRAQRRATGEHARLSR